MPKVRVGINGFGRIGRCAFRIARGRDDLEVVGINDLSDAATLAYLLRYDSVHGPWRESVEVREGAIEVAGQTIACTSQRDPSKIDWGSLGVSVVIESTGVFEKREQAARHLEGGARHVIISAPSKDADGMFVLGVNDAELDPARHRVVSMASCTTNCLAPVAKVLHDSFGIEHALVTTVHAYTSSQALLDTPLGDPRRSRAAALSIIPSTTGAAVAATKVLPALAGRMNGMALRVPVPDGSITDIVARLERPTTADAVNEALRVAASQAPLRGILRVSDEPIVSADILGDPHASIVDAPSTMMVGDRLLKVLSWYDNEWGYAARLVDFAKRLGAKYS
jgi:glyceraldehyde 3-phosphate dehydrogenase